MFQYVVAETFNLFLKNFPRYLLVVGIIAVPIVLLQINASISLAGIEGYQVQWEMQRMLSSGSFNADSMERLRGLQSSYAPGFNDLLLFIGCTIAAVLLAIMMPAVQLLLTRMKPGEFMALA